VSHSDLVLKRIFELARPFLKLFLGLNVQNILQKVMFIKYNILQENTAGACFLFVVLGFTGTGSEKLWEAGIGSGRSWSSSAVGREFWQRRASESQRNWEYINAPP